MRFVHRLLDVVASTIEAIMAALFASLFAVTILNIVLRNLAGIAWMWIPGFMRLAFIWLSFLGIAAVMRRGEHLVIDVLQRTLGARARRISLLLIHLSLLPFYGVLLVFGIEVTRVRMRVPFDTWAVPTGYAYLAVPVAAALLFAVTLGRRVITIREFRRA
jgi:TRAP-type C4-dicarboxylate transport system permease small subunit